jgi:fatty acid hydroxylase family protein
LRIQADETRLARKHGRTPTLVQAATRFIAHPSPWLIGALFIAATVARVLAGDWRLSDAWLPPLMVAVFPFFEWAVHTAILHWRPRRVGRYTIDPLLARKHRDHHADPRDVPLVFIPWQALVWVLAVSAGIGLFAFPRLGLGLTFLMVVGALGLCYEWTHFLIHSDYRPRSRMYRAVWRNHRLHHYRNEHYWFTVTTSGTADRILGTYPDPKTVTPSPTAKALHSA